MVLKKDQERIKVLLKDTITLLCKNGLTFQNEFSIEATIGITLDQDEVVLVSINEIIQSELNAAKLLAAQQAAEAKKETEDGHSENEGSPSSPSRRHRKRRRSKNTTSNAGSLGNDNDSAEDEDDASHTSDIEPPVKRLQKDVNIKREGDDEEDNGDDLVFVKQEMDTGDWMQMTGNQGQSMAENEQDSYQTSFSGGSQQDNLDFLQGSSLEPVATHSRTSNINKMPGRRSATVTSSSAQGAGGGSNSQMGDTDTANQPLQLVTGRPEKCVVQVPLQDDTIAIKPLSLTSKAPPAPSLPSAPTRITGSTAGLVPSLPTLPLQTSPAAAAAAAALAHNFVMLSPTIIGGGLGQPLALMSPPIGLPIAHNLAMIPTPPNSKSQLTTSNLNFSVPGPCVPPVAPVRNVANLTVTSPSIRGPRLANDLPLSFSPVDSLLKSYGKIGKVRRSSVCSSTSTMDPPISPVEKPTKARPTRRSSVDVMVLKLNESQEKEIVTFVNNMATLGYKVTVKEVCKMAHEMIFPKRQYKKMDVGNIKTFGPDWWKEFLVRHPEILEKDGQVLPCSAPKSV